MGSTTTSKFTLIGNIPLGTSVARKDLSRCSHRHHRSARPRYRPFHCLSVYLNERSHNTSFVIIFFSIFSNTHEAGEDTSHQHPHGSSLLYGIDPSTRTSRLTTKDTLHQRPNEQIVCPGIVLHREENSYLFQKYDLRSWEIFTFLPRFHRW